MSKIKEKKQKGNPLFDKVIDPISRGLSDKIEPIFKSFEDRIKSLEEEVSLLKQKKWN